MSETILSMYHKGIQMCKEGNEFINKAQKECGHPKEGVLVAQKSNYAYKDPLEALHKWKEYNCQLCGKWWSDE